MSPGLPLSVHVRVLPAHVVELAVHGEIDLASAPILQDTILDAFDEHRPALLRVDLAAVPFMDSTGLGALVAGRNHARQRNARFAVCRPCRRVLRVLTVTGLYDVLRDDRDGPVTAEPDPTSHPREHREAARP